MMGNAFAPTSLLELLGGWFDLPESINFYLFGSWLRDSPSANDVDILLVYPDGHLDKAHIIADSIRNITAEETYDVLALSTTEEHELGFIASERAVRIWPPAS
jgi:hypothetical protein